MEPDGGNAEQVEYWNGPEGSHWVDHEDRFDGMLAPFVAPILAATEVGAADHVLDVGCGSGALTRAAATHAARVVGVDLSEPMLTRARERADREGLTNVELVQGDAQVHPFGTEFDVVVSRFGVMFFADPVAAFVNLRAALRPGGRLAFVCWQGIAENQWVSVAAVAFARVVGPPEMPPAGAPGPFAFADRGRLVGILGDAGFGRVEVDDLRLPIVYGGGLALDDAVRFLAEGGMAKRLLAGSDPALTADAIAAARDALAPFETPEGVVLASASWLVRAA